MDTNRGRRGKNNIASRGSSDTRGRGGGRANRSRGGNSDARGTARGGNGGGRSDESSNHPQQEDVSSDPRGRGGRSTRSQGYRKNCNSRGASRGGRGGDNYHGNKEKLRPQPHNDKFGKYGIAYEKIEDLYKEFEGSVGEPPKNFRELSVIPAFDDISHRLPPYLRAAKVKGRYDSDEQYLDIQFRLLREYLIRPLRDGITAYRKGGTKETVLYAYSDVEIVDSTMDKKTGELISYVSVNVSKRMRWDKRLKYGSLVCLSHDDFDHNFLFATVIERELLPKGKVGLKLEGVSKIYSKWKYKMLESPAFFEAYRHVINALQSIEQDEPIPFSKYHVELETTTVAPAYSTDDRYNFKSLMKIDQELVQEIQRFNHVHFGMDKSQYSALVYALTSELAIIQGPPGTGKTYMGLQIEKLLFDNWNVWNRNERNARPLIVVCYTNHALDQFLEGISEFVKEGIIRVGERCKNEKIEQFCLSKKRRWENSTVHNQFYNTRGETVEDKKELEEMVTTLKAFESGFASAQQLKNVKWNTLNIAAYKNPIASDLFRNKNVEGLKKEKFGSIKTSKHCFTGSFKFQNPFEFIRQQEGDQRNEPEIYQFKSTQKLTDQAQNEKRDMFIKEVNATHYDKCLKQFLIESFENNAFAPEEPTNEIETIQELWDVYKNDEAGVPKCYDNPKDSFIYLLMDPRKLYENKRKHKEITFFVFLLSIFYLGSGQGTRSFKHFDDFLKLDDAEGDVLDEKNKRIMELFNYPLEKPNGISVLEIFHHLTEDGSKPFEATMIGVLEPKMPKKRYQLTNKIQGSYHEEKLNWTNEQKSYFGAYHLYCAYMIFKFGSKAKPIQLGSLRKDQKIFVQKPQTFLMRVPSNKTGLVIGKRGGTIKQICRKSGAHVELSRNRPPNASEKIFIVKGSPHQIHHAQHIIRIKIGDIKTGTPVPHFSGSNYAGAAAAMPTTYPYRTGFDGYYQWQQNGAYSTAQTDANQWPNYYQQQQQQLQAVSAYTNGADVYGATGESTTPASVASTQQQQPPSAGEPVQDFSAQWAEYYRQMGMHGYQ